LKTFFADGGYQGPQFGKAIAQVLPHLDIEIVKRSEPGQRLAQTPPKARQGLGKSQPKCGRLLAPRSCDLSSF
jgi:hypothetical protein